MQYLFSIAVAVCFFKLSLLHKRL